MTTYIRSLLLMLLLLTPLTRADAASRIFADGFEAGNTNLWEQDGTHPRCPVVTTAADAGLGPHTGSKMLRCNWGNDYESLVLNTLSYTNEIFYRAWIRIDTDMDRTTTSPIKFLRIFVPPNGPNYRDLFEGISDGHGLTLRGNAGTELIPTYWGDEPNSDVSANTTAWHKVEYYINHTTQKVRVWHDGLMIRDVNITFNSVKWYPFYITSNWSDDVDDLINHLYFDDLEVYSDNGTGATGLMSNATITVGGTVTIPNAPSNTQVTVH